MPTGGEDRKTETQDSPVAAVKVSGAPDKVMGVNVGATMALELPNANATEVWLQVLSTLVHLFFPLYF